MSTGMEGLEGPVGGIEGAEGGGPDGSRDLLATKRGKQAKATGQKIQRLASIEMQSMVCGHDGKRGLQAQRLPSIEFHDAREDDDQSGADLYSTESIQGLDDILAWPGLLLTDVQRSFGDDGLQRFLDMLRRGLNVRTYYSGMNCCMQAVEMLTKALVQLGLVASQKEMHVVNSHACDLAADSRKCLLAWEDSLGMAPRHVFGDLLHRRRKSVQRQLLQVERDIDEKFKTGDKKISKSLVGKAVKKRRRKFLVRRCSSELQTKMSKILMDNPLRIDATSWCYKHNAYCRVQDPVDAPCPFTMVVAGTTCTDTCPTGSRRGMSGRSATSFVSFMFEVAQSRPDVLIHECSHLFARDDLVRYLDAEYTVMQVTPLSPKDMLYWQIAGAKRSNNVVAGDLGGWASLPQIWRVGLLCHRTSEGCCF